MSDTSKRQIIVTGASSGIGAAIAIAFARAGCDVLVHGCRNVAGLAQTVESMERIASEQRFSILTADFASVAATADFFQQTIAACTSIDVWINAAGADVITGSAAAQDFLAKLEQLWQVDVRATMQLSRLAAEHMTKNSLQNAIRPLILNMSWDQAMRGMAGDSGQYFAATKAAIAAFSNSLAMSVGPTVRVNCLAPGWVQTAWGNAASSHWQSRAIGESSLGRWGNVDDVANAAVWLASRDAEFINGQTIAINGGWKPAY